MKIRTSSQNPPTGLLNALDTAKLTYTQPVDLYHCIALSAGESYCGVFGDGDNGAYEWFTWIDGKLETSNVAYGMTVAALRDVLVEIF